MLNLYPHNLQAYQAILAHYALGNTKAAIVHATGTGKSYIVASVTNHYHHPLVIAPNLFVLNETRKVCNPHTTFRTYASLMYDEQPPTDYDIIVLDEFHRAGADKWGKGVTTLINANPQAHILGTSATHIRYLDNERNMADELFDGHIVSYLPLTQAIDEHILPNPIYVSSLYEIDTTIQKYKPFLNRHYKKDIVDGITRNIKGLTDSWNKSNGVTSIISKYLPKTSQRLIVFCSDTNKAKQARSLLDTWLSAVGFDNILYYNIDSSEYGLKRQMEEFQSPVELGTLKVAIAVNMLNEGVHVPRIDAIIMLRSSISRIIIEQQIGRCLTADNITHTPIIFDLVNNLSLTDYSAYEFDIRANHNQTKGKSTMSFPFKVIDECQDIRIHLNQIQSIISEISTPHTLEECMASAKRFNSRAEWYRYDRRLYSCSLRHNWHEQCCAHMTYCYTTHTLEECKESAKKYKTMKEWRLNEPHLFSFARTHDWFDICCPHMPRRSRNITKEQCIASAKQYKTKEEWRKGDRSCYYWSNKHGIYDECCAHMTVTSRSRTLEECIASAKKYNSKHEWYEHEQQFYLYAKKHKWFDQCCAHMKVNKTSHTLEECTASAQQFTSRKQWQKNDTKFYTYAQRRGWLDQCCAHMRPQT